MAADNIKSESPLIRLRSRRLVCENTVFKVFFDHITDAHGHEVLEYLSVLPKRATEDMVTGVGVLPIKEGKLGLIRVFRHPLGRWSWEIPKGMIETSETAEQAALRELREETGFALQPNQLHEVGTTAPVAGLVKSRLRLYLATLNSSDSPCAVEDELGHDEVKFIRHQELADMITFGEIEDACTMSILLVYAVKRGHWTNQIDIR